MSEYRKIQVGNRIEKVWSKERKRVKSVSSYKNEWAGQNRVILYTAEGPSVYLTKHFCAALLELGVTSRMTPFRMKAIQATAPREVTVIGLKSDWGDKAYRHILATRTINSWKRRFQERMRA